MVPGPIKAAEITDQKRMFRSLDLTDTYYGIMAFVIADHVADSRACTRQIRILSFHTLFQLTGLAEELIHVHLPEEQQAV